VQELGFTARSSADLVEGIEADQEDGEERTYGNPSSWEPVQMLNFNDVCVFDVGGGKHSSIIKQTHVNASATILISLLKTFFCSFPRAAINH
jgi:hypothetical protein